MGLSLGWIFCAPLRASGRTLLVASTILGASAAGAQDTSGYLVPPPQSPDAAVAAVFEAMASKNWQRVAALADPEFLAQFREKQLVYAEADRIAKVNRKKNEQQYGLPKCVQKYFESQDANFTESFLKGFAGVKTVEQLAALSPPALFASWLAGGEHVRKEEGKNVPPTSRTILGQVPEGDTLAHVVYRITPPPPTQPEAALQMLTVRRENDGWRVLPNEDIRLAGRSFSWQGKK